MKKVIEGYKMTELGLIPHCWKVEKIDSLFDFYGGVSISRDKQSDYGVYYLHYGDIHKKNKNYFSIKEDCNWLPKIDIDVNDLKEGVLLNTGDIVFADASEDYEGIGKSVVIINDNKEHFVSGLHTIIAKDKVKELNTLYKKYCFNTTEVRKQFRTLATGATVYGISKSNIKNIKILVPTIEEQEKIALTLSSVDEQIEITDNLIEKTKELKKGLMQKLLTKGIGHNRFKDTEVGRIPEEWELRELGEIVQFSQGIQIPLEEQKLEWKNNFIRFLRIVDYTQNASDYRYILNPGEKYIVNEDDIIMVRYGATAGLVGKGLKGAIANNMFKISPNNESNLSKSYIYIFLKQDKVFNSLNLATGASAMPAINFGLVSKIKIVIPDLKEQKQISLILSSVDEQIDQYESKKEKLQELKKGLMQKLLTGGIRVKV